MNNKSKWDSLTLKEKSEIMKMAISSGVMDLDNIRSSYNSFAEGGPTERREHSEKREQRDSTDPHNYKTEIDPYREFTQPPEYTKYKLQDPAVQAELMEELGSVRGMNTSFRDKNGNVLGYTVPSGVEEIASFMPILGTAMDIGEFVNNPTWENAGYSILSLAAEIPLLKGLKSARAMKAAKVAKNTENFKVADAKYKKLDAKVKRMESTPNLNPDKIRAAKGDRSKAFFERKVLDPKTGKIPHNDLVEYKNLDSKIKGLEWGIIAVDESANIYQQFIR